MYKVRYLDNNKTSSMADFMPMCTYFLLTFPATQVVGLSRAESGTRPLMESMKMCSGRLAGSRRTTILDFACPLLGPFVLADRFDGAGLVLMRKCRGCRKCKGKSESGERRGMWNCGEARESPFVLGMSLRVRLTGLAEVSGLAGWRDTWRSRKPFFFCVY